MLFRNIAPFVFAVSCLTAQAAEPLSKSYPIDFFRDVPSRNLKGLATRSDGRLVSGPVLTDLDGPELPQLLWCLETIGDHRWLIGTGPEGKIVELSLGEKGDYTIRPIIALDEPQIQVIRRTADGSLLVGTSPNGTLALVRDGKLVSSAALPADSIFDAVVHDDSAFVATGNPAKIYKVNLRDFAAAGLDKARTKNPADLKAKGIVPFGEVRDRNIRRLTWAGDRLIAGSSPKGNIYAFAAAGGPAQLLQENRDAEVSALLPDANGDLYAAMVFTNASTESRINRVSSGKSAAEASPSELPPASPIERFGGRSSIVYLPQNGFPETLVSRAGLAFYALAKTGNILLIAGGEQGDVLGYDLIARQALSFAGSDSAQLNALAPIGSSSSGKFLALRNNTSGLAILDFAATGPRTAETRRLDLGIPSTIGAYRLNRLVNVSADQVRVDFRGNAGSDEIEGWSPWIKAERRSDGWAAPDFRARNVRLRIQIDATPGAAAELDSSQLFYLPQNRRPQLSEFHIAPANYALLAGGEPTPTNITTLAQLLATGNDKPKNPILNFNVTPEPHNQLITWVVTDPDNDTLAYTFSIKREGAEQWTDLALATRESYTQFSTSHLEDGVYQTRLIAAEQAPRPESERLSVTFDTDEIAVDNTPPTISELNVSKADGGLKITVAGHDAMSVLQGVQLSFNNGYKENVVQPIDGIRDSQTETFSLQIPAQKLAGASAVEVTLADISGNEVTRRVALP